MCHNTTLVRDKPLGAPTYVKLVYYDNAIVPHIWYLPQRKLALEKNIVMVTSFAKPLLSTVNILHDMP